MFCESNVSVIQFGETHSQAKIFLSVQPFCKYVVPASVCSHYINLSIKCIFVFRSFKMRCVLCKWKPLRYSGALFPLRYILYSLLKLYDVFIQ